MKSKIALLLATVSSLMIFNDNPTLSSSRATPAPEKLKLIATSENQWTGLAFAKDGGLFVNYPRWSDKVPVSVAHFPPDSDLHPFPNAYWNSWKPGESPADKFVCVQSVVLDAKGKLWVLDPASPKFAGVVPGGAKLLQFDPANGKLLKEYKFDSTIAPEKSYLNDVRFDKQMKHAFITDSGIGAIVVLNLETGKARRLLENDPSTKSEHVAVEIDGTVWKRNGTLPDVHADGIAIDAANEYLYYDALTARTLYRIPVATLLDESLDEKAVCSRVEKLINVGPNDGMEFGPDGWLYVTGLPYKAITRWKPGMSNSEIYIQDPRLNWPDSLALDSQGKMCVTTSRIHEGEKPAGPYEVYQFQLK